MFAAPIVGIHALLLRTGEVLMWDETAPEDTWLWDPTTEQFVQQVSNIDFQYCAGHVALADGRILSAAPVRPAACAIVRIWRGDRTWSVGLRRRKNPFTSIARMSCGQFFWPIVPPSALSLQAA